MREHLGVADLGRLLQIRVLHRQVPGAQHRVAAAAAVDQVIVRAEADAPRIEGVPPFQRPAGGGVPDDELAVVGVATPPASRRARTGCRATMSRCPRSRVDRLAGGRVHQERVASRCLVSVDASRVPSAFTSRRLDQVVSSAPPDPSRPSPRRTPSAASRCTGSGRPGSSAIPWRPVPVGTRDGGRGRGAEVPDHRVARGLARRSVPARGRSARWPPGSGRRR